MITRYAIVRNARSRREAEAYLPDNYRVVHEGLVTRFSDGGDSKQWRDSPRDVEGYVIEGCDSAGWTLDGYVIPRYASGLIWAEEIDLSHPIMREVPINA
jgi:hypothetical protein